MDKVDMVDMASDKVEVLHYKWDEVSLSQLLLLQQEPHQEMEIKIDDLQIVVDLRKQDYKAFHLDNLP